MRRRKHHRSVRVFWTALLSSLLIHGVLGFPLRDLVNAYLSSGNPKRVAPVRMVRVSPEQWSKNRQVTQRRTTPFKAQPPAPKPKPEAKPKPKEQTKLNGQIVELPPTRDDSPNPDAKYLSKYNTNVKKESVARYEERDRNKKRLTSRLQTKQRAPPRPKPRTPKRERSAQKKGDDLEAKSAGAGRGKKTDKGEFALELPTRKKKQDLKLRLSELPGFNQVPQRQGQEAMKGNGKRFRLELGGAGSGRKAGGKKGSPNGSDRPLPKLEDLQPTIGTIARINGSPSNDYVEGVPEGDETFLNAKEFKYATFFYRVKDSVGNLWYDMVLRELRRRDPTGNIYGPRDRATLLTIRIDLDGRLAEVRVANSSGVQFLDDVAVQAFKMAEPFPNPPAAMADPDGFIKFNFQFVMLRSRGPLNLFR